MTLRPMALVLNAIHTHGGWRGGGWHANDIIAPGYRLLAALDPRPLLSDRAVPRGSCRRARAVESFSGRRLVSFRILYVNWKLYVNPVESWLRVLSEPVGQSNHLA